MSDMIDTILTRTARKIDLPGLELDKGIAEYDAFYSGKLDAKISIGISRESNLELDDGHVGEGYIVNLFVGDEYVNIDGVYTKETMNIALQKIVQKANEYLSSDKSC